MRMLLAIVGAGLVALVGHGVFVALVVAGVPCLNTLYPGPSPIWLCNVVRFGFYAAVGSGALVTWRVISKRATPSPYAFWLAAIVWVYWYVLDPALLVQQAGAGRVGKRLMEWSYGTPFFGELYYGWGFAKWHIWLAMGQGVLTVALLLVMSRAAATETTTRRNEGAAEQGDEADER
jgi:hypothetical protein